MELLQDILCIVFKFSIYENSVRKVMAALKSCALNHIKPGFL